MNPIPADPLPASQRRRAALAAAIPDLEARQGRFDTGVETVEADIFTAFLDYLVQLAGELDAAAEAGATDRIRAIGHSIKGMGGSCAAPEISVLGEEFEIAARAGDLPRCRVLLAALRGWRAAAAP